MIVSGAGSGSFRRDLDRNGDLLPLGDFLAIYGSGFLANDLAYKMILLSGIQSVFLNLNPLIKADGYYVLAEYLRIDNLREDSFLYLRAWARKYLLREDIDLPPSTRRLRRIYMTFGLTAVVYSTSLLVLMLVFAKNVFVSKFGNWGYVVTLAVVYYFSRKGLKKGWHQLRVWWREKKEDYMAWKMTRGQQVGAVALAVLFLIPPVPSGSPPISYSSRGVMRTCGRRRRAWSARYSSNRVTR